jgi:hypothetical protein
MIVTPIKSTSEEGTNPNKQLLTSGQEYIVFAIVEDWKKKKSYYIIDDDDNYLVPKPYEATLFRVIDDSIPKHWVTTTKGFLLKKAYLTFPLWANDFDDFYYMLFDGSQREKEVFRAELKESGFYKQQQIKKYHGDLKMARERGYDWPEKPN